MRGHRWSPPLGGTDTVSSRGHAGMHLQRPPPCLPCRRRRLPRPAPPQRAGTLCVFDFKPRTFPAAHYAMLAHFSEILVRELERELVRSPHLFCTCAGTRLGEGTGEAGACLGCGRHTRCCAGHLQRTHRGASTPLCARPQALCWQRRELQRAQASLHLLRAMDVFHGARRRRLAGSAGDERERLHPRVHPVHAITPACLLPATPIPSHPTPITTSPSPSPQPSRTAPTPPLPHPLMLRAEGVALVDLAGDRWTMVRPLQHVGTHRGRVRLGAAPTNKCQRPAVPSLPPTYSPPQPPSPTPSPRSMQTTRSAHRQACPTCCKAPTAPQRRLSPPLQTSGPCLATSQPGLRTRTT